MSAHQNLIDFVAKHTFTDPEKIQITKLFGQASARQYFRATLSGTLPPNPSPLNPNPCSPVPNLDTSALRHFQPKADPPPAEGTFVVMLLPNGFSSPAEEITKIGKDAPTELSFINIQKYLASLEIKVPKIYAQDAEKGLLLIEDLGDTQFESLVKKAEGEFFLMFYRKAIDLLVEVQTKTLSNSPSPLFSRGGSRDCIAFHRSFDTDLLNWEWLHFLEYGIEDRLSTKVNEEDRQVFKESTEALTHLIKKMPQGFVLRDFQSRNIMMHNFDLYLIDFQDALMGPLLYDLVALLRDSYVTISPDQLDSLLNYYAGALPKEHPYAGMRDQVKKDFFVLTLHRKLKDTGRFQFIHTMRNNSNFLVHVPQSIEYVRHAFEMLDKMGCGQKELQKLIGSYLNELS